MKEYVIMGIIKQFAKDFNLDVWDWIAAGIAFISLVIAFFSLIIAFKTLLSQRETQKNTAPVITMQIQGLLWLKLIERSYINMLSVYALRILLKRKQYRQKPEECFVQNLIIKTENYIHEELFYTQETRFNQVHILIGWIERYNGYINSLVNHLDEKKLTEDVINRTIEKIDILCYGALKYYMLVFCKNNSLADDGYRYSKEWYDEELADGIVAHYKKTIINMLKYSLCENALNVDEKYSRNDTFVNFLDHFKNGDDLKKIYFYYSNRYIDVLLSQDNITLEND